MRSVWMYSPIQEFLPILIWGQCECTPVCRSTYLSWYEVSVSVLPYAGVPTSPDMRSVWMYSPMQEYLPLLIWGECDIWQAAPVGQHSWINENSTYSSCCAVLECREWQWQERSENTTLPVLKNTLFFPDSSHLKCVLVRSNLKLFVLSMFIIAIEATTFYCILNHCTSTE